MMKSQEPQPQQKRVARLLPFVSESARKIYQIIKEHPSTKKDLTFRTKYQSSQVDTFINQLLKYNLVKKIRTPQSKHLNVWVVYDYKEEEESRIDQNQKNDLFQFVRKKQTTLTFAELQKDALRKGFKIDNLQDIISVMEMRGQVLVSNDRITPRKMNIINSPCIECTLKDVCSPTGTINPTTCPYLLSW